MRLACISLTAVFAIAAGACSGDEEEPAPSASATTVATSSPTSVAPSTATPTGEATPGVGSPSPDFAAFRAFAAEVEAATAVGDAAFFADRGIEIEVICRGDEQLGQCMNEPAGTVIRGIPGAAWLSDASALIPRADYEVLVSEWFAAAIPGESDGHGNGTPRLVALGQSSEGEFLAIASLIRDAGASSIQRQCRAFRFSLVDGSWALRGEIFCYATATSDDWLSGACVECYDYWEAWKGS
jgi:hypothetical protein